MAKRTILTDSPRDFIETERNGETTIYRNPRTNQVLEIPRHATAHERRQAIKQLQEQVADPFAGVKAGEAMDLMARGGKPAPTGDSDPEPHRPVPGVGNPNSPYRLKQETLWREWKERQDAKAARAQKLDDDRRLADLFAERVGQQQVEQSAEPAADDLATYLPPELNMSWEQFKAKAEANGVGESGGSADAA